MSNFDDLGGLLVCEVAVQEPFVYTKVYALETYRFLSSNTIGFHPNSESAQAHYTFLNECDHIKVIRTICICFHSILNFLFSPPPLLLHLHSFTYDFHLRSLNSFVSGRQYLLKPAFHLVSFLDDFSKYYNKVTVTVVDC